ncbi:MAG: hypothetical protein PHN30_06485 [Bacteroidales bacterium]|jgi:hypothetical protein|nr:hypothetical protein [Bacteroidales bacterium]MDD2812992.1 hypothetical protein [Bacteroidales bacterium]MDD3385344.1 hypothetical protein [Bacteroidales bacterium]MDD3811937.1 hypothetical protein [Bacteroidales bacterium]MDD3871803.1 hypothetical protein [Bacteroidales bacterium]
MKRKIGIVLGIIAISSVIVVSAFNVEEGKDIGCTEAIPMSGNWGYCTLTYFEFFPNILESADCTVTDGYKNCNGVKLVVIPVGSPN